MTGILYFPKLKNQIELQKNKIQLYSNQVFITDSVENIVPEFLTLLHGVIDSPDIPLNVSGLTYKATVTLEKYLITLRKRLQINYPECLKRIEKILKANGTILMFYQYGILTDEFHEKAKSFSLLKNSKDEYFTLEEYKEKVKAAQTDKNDKLVFCILTIKKSTIPY